MTERKLGESNESYERRCKEEQLGNRKWYEHEMCQHGKDKARCPKCS